MERIAAGINRWTARHPEYRPRVEKVASYLLIEGDAVCLVDPLLPGDAAERAEVLAALDAAVAGRQRLEIFVTIPYHVRSVEPLYERYRERLAARVWGDAGLARRLGAGTPLHELPRVAAGAAAEVAGGAALAYTVGKPRRTDHPLYFPGLRAAAFGDAVVGTPAGLRFWKMSSSTGADWYRDVFAPTLAALAQQDIEYALVTHGPPVPGNARRALAECLAAPPVDRYPSSISGSGSWLSSSSWAD
jgi:hypothetical protein